jgi:DNA replication licensing factor MCM6
LAAANPLYGRYDTRKTLRQNIAMSAPIMSRFDLFFVVLDACDEAADYQIARHILSIHRLRDDALAPEIPCDKLQLYIKYARRLNPRFTDEAASLLVKKYCLLRQQDGPSSCYRMTVRQLESLIRLSEALARLHLDKAVQARYVQEAFRLLKGSLQRVTAEAVQLSSLSLDGHSDADGEASGVETGVLAAASPNLMHARDPVAAVPAVDPVPLQATLTLPYEEYARLANLIIYQVRQAEALSSNDTQNPTDENPVSNPRDEVGIRQSVLLDALLLQHEADFSSEAELLAFERRLKAVIHRLAHKDCILIQLKTADRDKDPLLVVHPNYQD